MRGSSGFATWASLLTKYVAVHNNTSMKRAALPVILLNTVRSTGATG